MRRQFIALYIIAAAIGGALAPADASGQDYDPDTPVSSEPIEGQSSAAVTSADSDAGSAMQPSYGGAAEDQGLSARDVPPRTLRAHWHVFVAFALIWLLLFGYALTIGRRLKTVEDEIRGARGS